MLKQLMKATQTRRKEWTNQNLPLSFYGNELAGETGEACNIIKKLDRETYGMVGSRSNLDELREELADIIICVANIAGQVGIDVELAVLEKFNKTSRKYGLLTRLEI